MEFYFPMNSNLETGDHFILNDRVVKHDAYFFFKRPHRDTIYLPASMVSKDIMDGEKRIVKSEPTSSFLYNQSFMIYIMRDTTLGYKVVNSATVDVSGRLKIRSKTDDPIVLEIPKDHPMQVKIKEK